MATIWISSSATMRASTPLMPYICEGLKMGATS
jgi:hypothetical protein